MIKGTKGFTILELAIGILLSGIIMSAAFSLYLTQHKQLLIQDEISDLQSNIRAATAELASRIRLAGSGLPRGLSSIESSDSNPDTITIAYDTGELNGLRIEYSMPEPSAILRCDGHDLSGIDENDRLFIVDPFLNTGEYFLVSAVDNSSACIQHNTSELGHPYPAGSEIHRINRFKYYVDLTDSTRPNLMRQANDEPPQVLAENITDIQFRYGLSSLIVVDVPVIDEMVRDVIIGVTARSGSPDNEFQRQYRTRTVTTRVKVRNLGIN